MNNNETLTVTQPTTTSANENLKCNLRQAINIINAEYQRIDWEDQAFLNRVLTRALSTIDTKGEEYADN